MIGRLLLVLTLITAVPLSSMAGPATARKVTIATGDYPPFASESLPHYGFVSRTITEAAKAVGMDVEFAFMPWKRALEASRAGQYVATSFWLRKPGREEDFLHVGPVQEERIVFFYRKDKPVPAWSSLEDLSGLVIGATNGYTYNKAFWEAAESGVLKVDVASDDATNFKKLLAGRIDLFVAGDVFGWNLLGDLFGEAERKRFATLERPLSVKPAYLLISRNAPDAEAIAASLQQGVDLIREQGLIDQFIEGLLQSVD